MLIITGLGHDPVWFGIPFRPNMQISYLSPPFAPAAFLSGRAPPEVSLADIFAQGPGLILLQALAIGAHHRLFPTRPWLPAHTQ